MKEIEVKAKVKNKSELLTSLESLGCVFSPPIIQRDRIFIPLGLTLPTAAGINVLRIREQDGKFILTLKQRLTNQLDCLEHEAVIDSPQECVEIFKLLGFYEVSQVNKIRKKCKYNDLEICFDEVEELGDYIEVEKLSQNDNSAQVQADLLNFLGTLGIGNEDQVWDGYDVLMFNMKRRVGNIK